MWAELPWEQEDAQLSVSDNSTGSNNLTLGANSLYLTSPYVCGRFQVPSCQSPSKEEFSILPISAMLSLALKDLPDFSSA